LTLAKIQCLKAEVVLPVDALVLLPEVLVQVAVQDRVGESVAEAKQVLEPIL
jgi:hypothetical protein